MDDLYSTSSLEKYFYIHKKSDILASVEKALLLLENEFKVTDKDQNTTNKVYRKTTKQSKKLNDASKQLPLPVYFINKAGKITHEGDENDPSQLVLTFKLSEFFTETKSSITLHELIRFLKNFRFLSNIFGFITNELTLSKKVRESIVVFINNVSGKRYIRLRLIYKTILSRKFKLKHGIGKGIEGYIPFSTWARGSLSISQFVNKFIFIDKLSQNKFMEITNGYQTV